MKTSKNILFFPIVLACALAITLAWGQVNVSPPLWVWIGSAAGKTVVMKTGNLVTTAVTADQVILTYTVTAQKTLFLSYVRVDTRLTTFAVTASYFGAASLENPASTKLVTQMQAGAGITDMPALNFEEPIPIAAGTVIRVVCTPSSTTSYTWQANFGGYER